MKSRVRIKWEEAQKLSKLRRIQKQFFGWRQRYEEIDQSVRRGKRIRQTPK